MKKSRCLGIILISCLSLAACGGGGGGSSASFDMSFKAPAGSGFAGAELANVPFAPNVARDFSLIAGIIVNGQVTDGAGAPLAGVRVGFGNSASDPGIAGDTTDVGGNYTVRLSAGTWVAVLQSGSSVLGDMSAVGLVVAGPGAVVFDFQFPTPVAVSGFAFELLGPAIPGAQVDFTGAQTGANVSVVCDGAGFYVTALVPDTYEAVVTPAGTSAATHLKERFSANAIAAPTTLDFSLQQGVQVSGTVFDNFGLPLLENTDVEVLLPAGSNFFPPADVTANSLDGTYSTGPVPLGIVTFQLEAPGDTGFPTQQFSRTIVGPTAQAEDFVQALGFVLSGTIYQDDGLTPEGNVEVEPIPQNGSLPPDDDKTAGSGFYEISLFPGTYDLLLTPEITNRQLPEMQSITVSANTTLDVTLTLGVLLMGTVTEPDGVTPASDVRVEISNVLGASNVTDGVGVYSFLSPVGMHTLDLEAESTPFEDMALDSVAGVVTTTPGPVVNDITMSLATTGSTVIQGTLFEPDGVTPIAGVEITAWNATGDELGRAFSAADGTYVLVIP